MLGRGRRERAVVVLLHAVAALALAAGLLARHLPGWQLMGYGGCVGIAALLAGAALGARWLKPARGTLAWTGAAWSWSTHGRMGVLETVTLRSVDLRLDLGGWMLLRLRTGRLPAAWCAVSRREAGVGWHGLRLALYQPPRRQIGDAQGAISPARSA